MKVNIELQPALKDRTGVGWYIYEVVKHLPKGKILITGTIFNFLKRRDDREVIKELNINISTFYLLPYRVYFFLMKKMHVPYNYFFRPKADLYHFMSYVVPYNVKGKVILTVYDLVVELFPETMEEKNREFLQKEMHRSIKRADHIITISDSVKSELINILNIDAKKIDVVSPGVDYKIFNEKVTDRQKAKIMQKYNLPEGYILYLGTLEPRKNIYSLLKAFINLKKEKKISEKLVIVGKKGWNYENIYKIIYENNIENEVVFTGYVDENEKPAIYQMAKLFVFPSIYEGFGIPVLEAMASGIPVIVSNTSSLPEVVGDAGILIDSQKTEDIEMSIYRILTDKKLSTELIEKGLRQSKKFTWENSANKLYDIYDKVGKGERL
jgi:glycosyltransferase involved in cell wall biosynthesis